MVAVKYSVVFLWTRGLLYSALFCSVLLRPETCDSVPHFLGYKKARAVPWNGFRRTAKTGNGHGSVPFIKCQVRRFLSFFPGPLPPPPAR